jgi:hypothetical protein
MASARRKLFHVKQFVLVTAQFLSIELHSEPAGELGLKAFRPGRLRLKSQQLFHVKHIAS